MRELLKRNWSHSRRLSWTFSQEKKKVIWEFVGSQGQEITGGYWTKTEFYFISRSFFLVPNTSTDFFYFILCYMFEMKIKTLWNLSNTQKKQESKLNFLIPSIKPYKSKNSKLAPKEKNSQMVLPNFWWYSLIWNSCFGSLYVSLCCWTTILSLSLN